MKKIGLVLIPVAVAGIALLLARVLFYPGGYEPPLYERPRYEEISATSPSAQPFVDQYKTGAGTIVIDRAHDNRFSPWELDVLLSRVVARGFAVEYLTKISPQNADGLSPAAISADRLSRLREKLRYADALAVIVPREAFPPDEIALIRSFVTKGGKLLLIGEPTRPGEINNIAGEFGFLFEADYLYNMKEYDGNYQNIFIAEFAPTGGIATDLAKIALYSAGSISSADSGIAFTGENTRSSVILTKDKFSPIALGEEAKVLAIADLTFMREPFNAVWDNNKLISNIADWLTASHRAFVLSDFPYFLKDGVALAYADPAVIDTAVSLKNFLEEKGKKSAPVQYGNASAISQDMVFMGFFKEADKITRHLVRGKISVTVKAGGGNKDEPAGEKPEPGEAKAPDDKVSNTAVEIDGLGQVFREEGIAIFYLDRQEGGVALIILADGEGTLKETVRMLRSGEFRRWLVSDELGIYYPGKP
ncbi:MAG: hypothetical protein HYX91_04730 [Chloroflexi bacterium]|nr:hypothetical protein [Chloroflexota bacterium]